MRIIHFNSGGKEFSNRPYQYEAHHVHMIDELRRAGHAVLHVNPPALLGRFADAAAYSEVTVEQVRAFRAQGGCDLFFATAVDHHLLPDAVREISAMGVPTVNLDMDDLTHPYRVRALTPAFDLVWTTARENVDVIRGYGAAKLVQMPFAANPHTFYPVPTETEVRAVCFVGACYGARARAVGSLARAGVATRVYGSSPVDVYGGDRIPVPALRALFYWQEGWERLFKSLSYRTGRRCIGAGLKRSLEMLSRDLPETYLQADAVAYEPGPSFDQMPHYMSRAALSLGSMEVASTFVFAEPLQFIRFREFEAPMCGAVHLANAYPELKEYFEEEREMLFYDGFEDLVDKARFWLDPARDGARREIRARARARAEADHTWRRRFQRCFDALGIPATV